MNFVLRVTSGSGCSVGGTRLVTHATFVLIYVLTTPVLAKDTVAQGCWCVRVRSYAGLTRMQ